MDLTNTSTKTIKVGSLGELKNRTICVLSFGWSGSFVSTTKRMSSRNFVGCTNYSVSGSIATIS